MAHFAKMIDMAKSPAEVKKDLGGPTPVPGCDVATPAYPYGLCITLTEDDLAKLHIDEDCEDGDMIHLCAMAQVTSCSSRTDVLANGEKKRTRRIELQITHLATENEDAESESMPAEERAARRYGGDDAEGED